MNRPFAIWLLICALFVPYNTYAAPADPPAQNKDEATYDQTTIITRASAFFGNASEGLAKAVEEAFRDNGRPNAYIEGEEIGGALSIGVCYGDGTLTNRNGDTRRLYWQGPSLGFDAGLNAAKVFVLVYHLPQTDDIFQRFPGVQGSFYYFAGIGVNYLTINGIIVAPIHLGMGMRTGASVGYMHITETPSWNPF